MLREKLEKARPAIEAQGPPTPEQRDAGADMKGFPNGTPYGDMIGAQAALFDLDHRWWPTHREAVLALIEAAQKMVAGEYERYSVDPKYWAAVQRGDFEAVVAALNEV